MIPTLYMRIKVRDKRCADFLWEEVECLFLDEVHHLSSESWLHVSKRCNAYFRYGLSATPLMRDAISNLKLIGQTGGAVGGVTNVDLIERGISAKPLVKVVSNRTIGVDLERKSWQTAYRLGIETNLNRNSLIACIVDNARHESKPVLILVNTVKHLISLYWELVERFGKEGAKRVVMLSGMTPGEDRMKHVKALSRRKLDVMIATPIFDEGMDMPEIRVLVLAGGGKSQIKLLQRVGRGMRRKETGENVVEVYDFLDIGNRYLEQHARRRIDVYRSQGFDVEVKEVEGEQPLRGVL